MSCSVFGGGYTGRARTGRRLGRPYESARCMVARSLPEVIRDDLTGRKLWIQITPLAASARDPEKGIKNVTQGVFPFAFEGQKAFNFVPLAVGQPSALLVHVLSSLATYKTRPAAIFRLI